MSDPIRVLIAEDSPTVSRYLRSLIDASPGMQVVGEAGNGEQVVRMVQQMRPDVVSMDINMPLVDGLEATRRIMSLCPTPVVVVSGMLDVDIQLSLQALQAGALAVVGKPPDRHNPEFKQKARHLLTTLRAMSGVRVISRRDRLRGDDEDSREMTTLTDTRPTRPRRPMKPEIIGIGASTGGPSALHTLLHALPGDLPFPLVIVQHMPDEFIAGLVRWLDNTTELSVQIAVDGMILQPGMAVLAPGSHHLVVARQGTDLIARLMRARGNYRHQPSVNVLFESIARNCGSAAAGIILTGMGDDGASGLLAMRQAGARTIAQAEAGCTVFGMPQAAIQMGAASRVKPLANLSSEIMKLV